MDIDHSKDNRVLYAICPKCGSRMLWTNFEPGDSFPGADYVAVCLNCCERFGVKAVSNNGLEV